MAEQSLSGMIKKEASEAFTRQVSERGFKKKIALQGAAMTWVSLPEYIQARLMSLANKGVMDAEQYWATLRQAMADMPAKPPTGLGEKKINEMFDQIDEDMRKNRRAKGGRSAG